VNGHVGIEQYCGSAFEVIGYGFYSESFEFSAQQVVFDGGFGLNISRSANAFHHGGPVEVVEQGAHSYEADGPEQLLVVEASVFFSELRVPLVRHRSKFVVKRHGDWFDR